MSTATETVTSVGRPAYSGLILPAVMIGIAVVLFFTLDTKAAAPDFTLWHFFTLAVILFAAGMMSGLTGFAFSAVGALALFLLAPITGVPLLQALSACNQMLSVGKLRKEMPRTFAQWWPKGPGPAILGGLVAVPLGVWLLNNLPAQRIILILSILIIIYAAYALFKADGSKVAGLDGAPAGLLIGALGGAIGGFTAFPGLTVVIWTGVRGLPKAMSRAIVQPFILTLQIVSLTTNALQHPKNFGLPFWTMLALMVPVVLPGTLSGVWLYHRVSEHNFKRACSILLAIAGLGLLLKAIR